MDAHAFSGRKSGFGGERLGGLSAAGKGLVLVQNSDSSPLKSVHPAPVAQKKPCVNTATTEDIRAMDNMIEVYEPTNSVVMVLCQQRWLKFRHHVTQTELP